MTRKKPETPDEFMRRYPRITAHIIAESLGYATPTTAAIIGLDGMNRGRNCCEWVYSCHGGDAYRGLERSIINRHYHKGFMTEYKLAKKLVDHALQTGEEPLLASWF
jgi:hypothetical protein